MLNSRFKIVTSPAELPDPAIFNGVLALDEETTSFDPKVAAYHPYLGHRVAGYGLMTEDRHGWYIPVRHRGSQVFGNLGLDCLTRYLADLDKAIQKIIGHNVKFDLRFSQFDGFHGVRAELIDTVVLARLVDSMAFTADLASVSKKFNGPDFQTTESTLEEWKAKLKTKDYGDLPVDIVGMYCLQDLNCTLEALKNMSLKLPDDSKRMWQIEKDCTATLLKSERRGVYVPRRPLLKYARQLAVEAEQLYGKVEELVGEPVNAKSNKQLTAILRDKMCIQPTEFSDKTGEPSWSAENLRLYDTPLTNYLADLMEAEYQLSSFGEGWIDRLAADETLHPNFKQYGAKTGRFACEDPNFQNLNAAAKKQVCPRPGYRFVSIDASQIEFRFFGHYTNSPKIIQRYNENPNTDYHQETANLLGIPRKPTKNLNFGFIYGMGREKLLGQLSVFIKSALINQHLKDPADAEKVAEAVKTLQTLQQFNHFEKIEEKHCLNISSRVYDHMHRLFPEIRGFQRVVENVIRQRGYVRNIYGRYYWLPQQLAHKGRNYVIQGSAADYLKDCLAKLQPVLDKWGSFLIANVHDEELFEVPLENTDGFIADIVPLLETPSVQLRVPLKVDVSICDKNWGDKISLEKWREQRTQTLTVTAA